MTNAEVYYLNEVLGLSHVAMPKSLKQEVEKHAHRAMVIVYTPFALNDNESLLVQKMLASIDVREAQFFNQHDHNAQDILAFSKEHVHCFGISFGIKPPLTLHSEWVELVSVHQFLDDSNADKLKQIKTKAWTELKALKARMK